MSLIFLNEKPVHNSDLEWNLNKPASFFEMEEKEAGFHLILNFKCDFCIYPVLADFSIGDSCTLFLNIN